MFKAEDKLKLDKLYSEYGQARIAHDALTAKLNQLLRDISDLRKRQEKEACDKKS